MKCRLSKRSYRLWCHSFQNLSGELIEFYDVDERRTMATQEHYLCTSIAWDPSGRIVTTAVTQAITDPNPRFTNSNAYNFYKHGCWGMTHRLNHAYMMDSQSECTRWPTVVHAVIHDRSALSTYSDSAQPSSMWQKCADLTDSSAAACM